MAGVVGPCPSCKNEISAPNPQFQIAAQIAVHAQHGASVQLPSPQIPELGSRGTYEPPALPPFPNPEPAQQSAPVLPLEPEENDLNIDLALAASQPQPPQQQIDPILASAPIPAQQPQAPLDLSVFFDQPAPVPAPQIQIPAAPSPVPVQPRQMPEQIQPPQQQYQELPIPQAPDPQQAQFPAAPQFPQTQPAPVQEQPVQQQPAQPFPQAQPQPHLQQPGQSDGLLPAQPNFPQQLPQSAVSSDPFQTAAQQAPVAPAQVPVQRHPAKTKPLAKRRRFPKILLFAFVALLLIGGVCAAALKFWPELREKVTNRFKGSPESTAPIMPSQPAPESKIEKPESTALPLGPQKIDTPDETAIPSHPDDKHRVDAPGPSQFPDTTEVKSAQPVNPGDENNAEPVSPAPKATPMAIPAPSATSEASKKDQPSAEEVDAARKLLTDFMATKTVEERLKFVQSPTTIGGQMTRYYAKHPYPMEPDQIDFKFANPLQGSTHRFFIFEVTTVQQKTPFPVAIEETDDGLKLDWRSFVEFHDNMLGRFMSVPQAESESFRVMMERAHYFKDDIKDKGSKICIRVKPPIPGFEGFAFAEKDSEIGKQLDTKFEWDVLYLPILELKWVQKEDGSKYVRVERIVQDNWRAAD
jgi:hypothetical protein